MDLIAFVEGMVECRAESMGLIVMLTFIRNAVLVILERVNISQTNRRLFELPIQRRTGAYFEPEGLPMQAGGQHRTVRERLIVVIVKTAQRGGNAPGFGCIRVKRRGRGSLHT